MHSILYCQPIEFRDYVGAFFRYCSMGSCFPGEFSRHFPLQDSLPSWGFQHAVLIACRHFQVFNNGNLCLLVSGWGTLSFPSRHSWLLFCENLKDTRDLMHCTVQVFENFSCHSCLFTLCVIIWIENFDTPLLNSNIHFFMEVKCVFLQSI